MRKITILMTEIILMLAIVLPVGAAEQNLATWVFPVRGRDYWRQGRDLEHLTSIINLVNQAQIPATWLLHYDTFTDEQIVQRLKSLNKTQERGLFLEVTRQLALDSRVNYPWESEKWERADKVFLSGYEPVDRMKLIDTAMDKFKQVYGYYPTSVGAWYIDGRSLVYLHEKYEVEAVLGVADQYLTDGYQIWGQYMGEPYYPSKGSVIEPALNEEDKINLVKLQWAPREPLLSYGVGEKYSNYSAQANDFGRSKSLGLDYFAKLVKTYTTNVEIDLAQITLGIEVGELQPDYLPIVAGQMRVVENLGLTPLSMTNFAKVYKQIYPEISPALTITSTSGGRSIFWSQSALKRYAILTENGEEKLVDLRFYHTSPYFENDWNEADRRQNLYRVVPAQVDQVGLGNSLPERSFLNPPPVQSATQLGQLSSKDKLRLWIAKFIPDIRASRINGRWVIGWVKDPQTLCLITCSYYPYPYLEAFLKLDDWRKPELDWSARWQDQLQNRFPDEMAVIKNTTYGIDALSQELTGPKKFENSYYYIEE